MQILIADDEPAHLFLLEMFLKKWGYDVISADTGTEAWQILQQEGAPRLVILDWMLPGMNGLEICQQVRKTETQFYTYILMLTARAQESDIHKGREAGADDYMIKPFDPEELRARLLAGCRILESKCDPAFSWA